MKIKRIAIAALVAASSFASAAPADPMHESLLAFGAQAVLYQVNECMQSGVVGVPKEISAAHYVLFALRVLELDGLRGNEFDKAAISGLDRVGVLVRGGGDLKTVVMGSLDSWVKALPANKSEAVLNALSRSQNYCGQAFKYEASAGNGAPPGFGKFGK